jgi:hypothetical protein
MSRLVPIARPTSERGSADQPAQPISRTEPGIPIIVELVADHLANLKQPIDLRLKGLFSSFQVGGIRFIDRVLARPSLAPAENTR